MNRTIKSDLPPPHPPPKKNLKKMNKKEQPVRFEPRKCSLWFSNPPRYHLSYLEIIEYLSYHER